MKIQWVEDLCNRGGLRTTDREAMRQLADEIYRLKESAHQVVDASVDHHALNQEKIMELEKLIQEMAHKQQSLILEIDHLRSQLKFEKSVVEEEPKKKRSKKN